MAAILRDYGLPLAILLVFGWALFTGRLHTNATVLALTAEIAYRESIRQQEHDARVAAEERTDIALKVMESHTELLKAIDRDILSGNRDHRGTHS